MNSRKLTSTLAIPLSLVAATQVRGAGPPLLNKTLVAWVSPANLTQQGGSVLTIDDRQAGFDGIVFGEISARKWMAGSEIWSRTQQSQGSYALETATPGTYVQIAMVYEGNQIRAYRNGNLYSQHAIASAREFPSFSSVLIGKRHITMSATAGTGHFAGMIDDARIYDRALTAAELAALQPNNNAGPAMWAWWNFEATPAVELTGRYPTTTLVNGASLSAGKLVLDGVNDTMLGETGEPVPAEQPVWPANPPSDWMTYHLAHPGPGVGMPGDPNCAFYWKGRYHLHYIYQNASGFCFAHVSSEDMVHWEWHPTTLTPLVQGHGMFSGTGFFTKDGRPAIIYHGQGSSRNMISISQDDNLETWSAPVAIEPTVLPGQDESLIANWDPDAWLDGNTYYALSGGIPGSNPKPATLFRSTNLQNWDYLGRFYDAEPPGVQADEDVSCPNFFKIGNKWMLLCISHNLGCRYYLGDWQNEKFIPESHFRMNWNTKRDCFAPESLLAPDGRRVMWAWQDDANSPREPQSGIQCLPRELSLPADGVLRIKPLTELETLRSAHRRRENIAVPAGTTLQPANIAGDSLELKLTFNRGTATRFGLKVYCDASGTGGVSIWVNPAAATLTVGATVAPLTLAAGEKAEFRVFLDKSMIEVFANDRQAVVYPFYNTANLRVALISEGGNATMESLDAWTMLSSYVMPPNDPRGFAVVHDDEGGIVAFFRGVPGVSYTLQRSADMGPESWIDIATSEAPATGLVEMLDPEPLEGRAFYRISYEP